MKETIDLLFVHVPKFSDYYRPYGKYMTVNLLPMGTWVLADLAVRHGYETKILHLGMEWIETGKFSALPYLENKEVRVVAIPLHWHQQSYDAIEAAKEIKKARPEIFIVLGGDTAGFFNQEILSKFQQIDAVICGDAETPLPALMDALKYGKDLHTVPNLSWRHESEIRENPLSYVASVQDLELASYANLELLKDGKTYMRRMGMPFVWSKGISREKNRKHFHLGLSMFFLNIGRGCQGNCTWCGGGSMAQRRVNGRTGVIFRSAEKVMETAAEAAALGYKMIHIAFDPGKEAEEYYMELFLLFRKNGLRLRCYFESFSLPSDSFLQAFAKTFDPAGSVIAVSPESGDEQIRRHNKSFSFSNNALMKTISLAEKLGIRIDMFFSMGIPGETYSNLARTAALRRQVRRNFRNIVRIWTSPLSMEPASPWYCEPAAFGIVSERRSFVDYYNAGSPDGGGPGYYIPDFKGNGHNLDAVAFERLLRKAKCRDHCSLHTNPKKASSPFWGRMTCHYLNWATGRRPGIT
ncbi:MAG: radical SAM protein [Deltaproteobacteria bacterium]|nr:radical SAM protein [Deltaproteobacteria bacterium]